MLNWPATTADLALQATVGAWSARVVVVVVVAVGAVVDVVVEVVVAVLSDGIDGGGLFEAGGGPGGASGMEDPFGEGVLLGGRGRPPGPGELGGPTGPVAGLELS